MQSLRPIGFSAHHLRSVSTSWVSLVRQLSSLVVAEAKGTTLGSAYPHLLSAASRTGGDVTCLVVGDFDTDAVSRTAAGFPGVAKVLVANSSKTAHLPAEPLAHLLAEVQRRYSFSHILTPANTFGKNLLPRAAALLGVQPVGDVIQIEDGDTFIRPIYAGNALATVKVTSSGVRMLTVRPTGFPAVQPQASSSASVENLQDLLQEALETASCGVEWEGDQIQKSERPELAAARVVVSGGRALKSADNFKMLESLADLLGGAVGASRAAVDAGFVSNDLQVGQTGKVVAPDLYIGIGISGAIQHLAGMKDAKTIVAINTDASAPIFQVADYGLVQDLFTAVPELEKQIRALKT